ncbi:putative membrane protein [Bradyrhizobium elkanii]
MTATHRQPSMGFELALLLALATMWGGSYTFIKLGVATIPPITLIAARTAIAGLLLLAIMRMRGVTMPADGATWVRFIFQACLNSVIPWTLIAWGERFVDAGLATILNSASPIFTFLFTAAITRHEAASLRKLFGVISGMAGICLIVGVDAFRDLGQGILAEVAIVAATICYACAAIFSRGFKGLDPMAPAAGSLIARRCDPRSAQPCRRAALDAVAVDDVARRITGACDVLDRDRVRDLLSPDPDPRLGRHHRAGLLAGADRGGAQRHGAGRAVEPDGVDRPRLRRDRRRRDDDSCTKDRHSLTSSPR